jgi:iron complex outermembrane receptor protein
MAISKTSSRGLLTTAIWMALAGAAHAQEQQPAQSEPSAEAAVDLDRVMVTATKRPEVLADVPQSITVIGEETLERQQADNLQDYLALIPGLSLEGSTRGVSRITLRGINTGGVASTVGVYVDDVPFGSSSGLANGAILAGDFDTFDVARIEVLRGPQGTLYGASSLGGVLKFVTNEPSTAGFEARGKVGFESVEGGGFGHSVAGLINIPLSDRAAIRASAFNRFDDGFIDSIGNNPIASLDPATGLPDPSVSIVQGTRIADDINELKTHGGRISGLFEASDTFSVRLSALFQNIESTASNAFDADLATLDPLYSSSGHDLVASQYHAEFSDVEYRLYSANVDWDLGFANLQSSTSYGTFERDQRIDQAFALGPLITLFFGDRETRPLSVITDQTTSTEKFTQELRLSSPANDRFEWLVGGYYSKENSAIDPQDFFAVEAGTDTRATDIPRLIEVFLDSTYEEYAAFANATWHISPRFGLTFGGRASHNEQVATQLIDQTALGGTRDAFEDARSSEDVFTYSLAPRFELNDNASLYARVATGYRPGGPNVLPPLAPPGTPNSYDADSLTSYEIGLKAESVDRRFGLDVAAYYLDWKDIQLFAFVNDVGINANGGTAVSKGVEFTATARPTSNLRFAFNGAYTDAYLTEDTDPVVGGLEGDPLPYVPDWSLSLSGDYEWPVMDSATAYVGGTISTTGDRTADFSTRTPAPESRIREVPSYESIDLRAGIEFGRWSLEAYVKNLTDERGITSLVGDGTLLPNEAIGVAIIRPRTIGLTIGASF